MLKLYHGSDVAIDKIDFITDYLFAELVKLIMQYRHLPFQEALDMLYNSALYDKITDLETGLYLQSPDYNYELLEEELPVKDFTHY